MLSNISWGYEDGVVLDAGDWICTGEFGAVSDFANGYYKVI